MLKKSLLAIVLGTVGCASDDFIELSSSTKLYVNLSRQHYSIIKSQEEGEKDLIELAKTSEYEEAWLFDKVKQKWLELGMLETKCDVATPLKDVIFPKDAIFYHIHPSHIFKDKKALYEKYSKEEEDIIEKLKDNSLTDKKRAELKSSLSEIESFKLFTKMELLYLAAFPSYTDIYAMDKSNLKNAVASEHGIMYYSPNKKEGQEKIRSNLVTLYQFLTPEILNLQLEGGYTDEAAIWLTANYITRKVLNNKFELRFKSALPKISLHKN